MIHHQGWRSWGESKLIVHSKVDLPMKGLLVALVVGLGFTACASTGPVSMGKDTYMLAKPGGFLTVAGGEVKADLFREADQYCRGQNKHLMPISSSARDAGVAQYASAEIQFRCLAEGDPELRRPNMEPLPDVRIEMNTK